VHAHQFLMGRLSSALVLGNPSSAEVPAKRALTGMIVGLAVALLIGIGVGVFGLIVPARDTAWQEPGVIIVEEESGNRFVYAGDTLYPVLNQASALLLLGSGARVEVTARGSLAGVPRGAPVGIPDAPQIMPGPGDLVRGPWLVCLAGGADRPATRVDFDPATPTAVLPADRALSLVSEDGTRYVVHRGVKYPVGDPAVPVALGMGTAPSVPAPRTWLDELRTGPELAAADIPDAGEEGPEIGDRAHDVGQLFLLRPAGGDVQMFVLRPDGLAPLSLMEFTLLATRRDSGEPVELSLADVTGAPQSADRSLLSRLPDLTGLRVPDLRGASICLRQQPSGERVTSTVVVARDARAAVRVRPGTGLLVSALPVPKGKTPTRYLITDQGVKYLVPDTESVTALGFGGVAATPVTGELLAALPTGPVLRRGALTEKG
jgi:ESX secretion system ATPase EccB